MAKNNKANIQATWALRSLVSQIEYIVDVKGVKALPPESSQPPPLKLDGDYEEPMRLTYKIEMPQIKASKFLLASVGLGQSLAGGEDESGGSEQMKQFGELLDSQLPADIYRSVSLTASWNDGQTTRSTDLGMLLIDRSAVHIGIPGLTQ